MSQPLMLLIAALGVLTALAAVFWPEKGLLARWKVNRERTERVLQEDILKHLHKCELEDRRPTLESVAGSIGANSDAAVQLLRQLEGRQLIQLEGGEFRLTGAGRRYALHIVRAHRLWERYLADKTGIAETEWHRQAERLEHTLTAEELDSLSTELHHPVYDPHGDPIPTREGALRTRDEFALPSAPVGKPLRITHVEDEPEIVYAQLIAEGLRPGMLLELAEVRPDRILFWSEGEEHSLAPIVARNIFVERLKTSKLAESGNPLTDLAPGQSARVVGISRSCRGAERRRFMDLGILPGTRIEAEMTSPGGDPMAFRVRGALIALRREQATSIYVDTPVKLEGTSA